MTKVILSQRDDSGYDDDPGKRYHFPKQYLRAAQQAVGDECIFYEPRRGEAGVSTGRQSYWASATIQSVYTDPNRADHFYAQLANFLPFVNPVPFRRGDGDFWASVKARWEFPFAEYQITSSPSFGPLGMPK